MEVVCLTCGDIGFEKELVFCFHCLEAAMHTYCMHETETPAEGSKPAFLCEECLYADDVSSDETVAAFESSWERKHIVVDSVECLKIHMNGYRLVERSHSKDHWTNFMCSFAVCSGGDDTSDIPLEPVINSVWTGSFKLYYKNSIDRVLEGFSAYISNKADKSVYKYKNSLKELMEFYVLPKSSTWSERYRSKGPMFTDIEIYFFPSLMQHEVFYDGLVLEMRRNDLAMRSNLGNSELLVFTSDELPGRSRVFQGKLYLWGFFRELQQQAKF